MSGRPVLTERDKLVLRFIFQGLTNRDIAGRLRISESGAKSALRQLFDKLGVRTSEVFDLKPTSVAARKPVESGSWRVFRNC